ncbi:hypothetical protein D3C81_1421990 [compost metagenome]
MYRQLILPVLLRYTPHQQTQQPLLACANDAGSGLEPGQCRLRAFAVRQGYGFRLQRQDVILNGSHLGRWHVSPPPARRFQHMLLDPVQRYFIRKRRAVTEGQRLQP